MSTTYNARVFMEQGATKLVCTTGGEIEMRTGSKFDQHTGSSMSLGGTITSTGTIALNNAVTLGGNSTVGSTGVVTFSSGAKLYHETVQTLTTTLSILNNYGHSRVTPSSSGTYQLRQPEKGLRKTITCLSSDPLFIRSTAASSTAPAFCIGTTATPMHSCINIKGTSHHGDHGNTIELMGVAANLWDIISPVRTVTTVPFGGTVTITTTT